MKGENQDESESDYGRESGSEKRSVKEIMPYSSPSLKK